MNVAFWFKLNFTKLLMLKKPIIFFFQTKTFHMGIRKVLLRNLQKWKRKRKSLKHKEKKKNKKRQRSWFWHAAKKLWTSKLEMGRLYFKRGRSCRKMLTAYYKKIYFGIFMLSFRDRDCCAVWFPKNFIDIRQLQVSRVRSALT